MAFIDDWNSSDNPVGFCVACLLAWIAQCDNVVSREELEFLKGLTHVGVGEDEVTRALAHRHNSNTAHLKVACRLARLLPSSQKHLLMELAIMTVLADKKMRNAEAHIVLFIADLLDISIDSLNVYFHKATGYSFPIPGDVSSVEWWRKREPQKDNGSRPPDRESDLNGQSSALAILGLESDATPHEIRSAFHNLSKIHHPDRFVQLGPEAVAVATSTFKRILEAYTALGAP